MRSASYPIFTNLFVAIRYVYQHSVVPRPVTTAKVALDTARNGSRVLPNASPLGAPMSLLASAGTALAAGSSALVDASGNPSALGIFASEFFGTFLSLIHI